MTQRQHCLRCRWFGEAYPVAIPIGKIRQRASLETASVMAQAASLLTTCSTDTGKTVGNVTRDTMRVPVVHPGFRGSAGTSVPHRLI